MFAPLVSDLDAVHGLLEGHISELHAQLNHTNAKFNLQQTQTVRPKRARVPPKEALAVQPKIRRKQKTGNHLTGRWNKHEHDMFLRGLEMYGKEWKKMAGLIPSRTVVQIRTHAQKYFQKLKKRKARGKSIDSVTKIGDVKSAPSTPKKKKRASVPNKSELPVLIPIEDKKVKTKRSNSKRASASAKKKLKVQVQTKLKEPHRDGSPKSHFDLTFHFPHQSVPESATNLFPAVFSPDLNFDNMIFGECPSEFTSLLDMIPDKSIESPMPMWNDLLSIEDLNGDNDINFPEFNW